jgi:hypothetical protein
MLVGRAIKVKKTCSMHMREVTRESFVNQIQVALWLDYFIVNNGGRINKGRARPARACQSNWNKIRVICRMRMISPS